MRIQQDTSYNMLQQGMSRYIHHICIYLCVWTIWGDVKLLSFAEGRGMQSGTTSNEATWLHGMHNLITSAYLLKFPICMASSQANSRQAVFSFLHNWRNLRLRWKDSYRFIYLDVLRWILVTGQSYVFSSSDQELLKCCFARPMHSTTEFAMTVLSKCVTSEQM